MTPLGGPVVPEVYMMQARSSGLGGTGSTGFFFPDSRSSSYVVMVRWSWAAFRASMSSWGTSSL